MFSKKRNQKIMDGAIENVNKEGKIGEKFIKWLGKASNFKTKKLIKTDEKKAYTLSMILTGDSFRKFLDAQVQICNEGLDALIKKRKKIEESNKK